MESNVNLDWAGHPRQRIARAIVENRKKLLWTGVAIALAGLVALIFPVITSVTIELLLGWLLFFTGIISFFYSFSFKGVGPFFGALLWGLVQIAVGIYFITHPFVGLLILTIILASLFFLEGAYKIVAAFELKPTEGWGWMLVSSTISIVLGISILSGIPVSSMLILGVYVGINFLFSGITLIMVSRVVKTQPE